MKKSKLYITIILITINFFFFSCKYSLIDSDSKIFRYNESSGVSSLDPMFSNTKANIWAVNHIFNGLVDLDADLNIIPCIAHSWIKSDDGLEYTFYLRDYVFFS